MADLFRTKAWQLRLYDYLASLTHFDHESLVYKIGWVANAAPSAIAVDSDA